MMMRQCKFSMLFCAVAIAISLQEAGGYTTTSSTLTNSRCGWASMGHRNKYPSQRNNYHPSFLLEKAPTTNRQVACHNNMASSDSSALSEQDEGKKDEPLTPEKIAELIEVSFVNGVMQLAQGYVDVLKLFIAAVQSGYALGMSPGNLLDTVAECPEQSANRPLMDEEVKLRTTWIQVVYLVLDHVHYKEKNLGDLDLVNQREGSSDGLDQSVQETYGGAIPMVSQARDEEESFEADKIMKKCSSVLPSINDDPLEKAILAQSLRVIWLTLTVLEEEAICLEDKEPMAPNPPIPGAFD